MCCRGVEVEGDKTLGRASSKSDNGGKAEENRGKTRGEQEENRKVLKANQELL